MVSLPRETALMQLYLIVLIVLKQPGKAGITRREKLRELTCPLLLPFHVFFLFVICCLRVKVVVGVFGQFPLIVLVHQV